MGGVYIWQWEEGICPWTWMVLNPKLSESSSLAAKRKTEFLKVWHWSHWALLKKKNHKVWKSEVLSALYHIKHMLARAVSLCTGLVSYSYLRVMQRLLPYSTPTSSYWHSMCMHIAYAKDIPKESTVCSGQKSSNEITQVWLFVEAFTYLCDLGKTLSPNLPSPKWKFNHSNSQNCEDCVSTKGLPRPGGGGARL